MTFGVIAAAGTSAVTAWMLATHQTAIVIPPLAMGAVGLAGGAITAMRSKRFWWAGVACGAVLLVLSLWRLRDIGPYYLPFGMLLVAMGQVVVRERLGASPGAAGGLPKARDRAR